MGRIVLDTGVLCDPALLERLFAAQQPTVLPVVAFTERTWQIVGAAASKKSGASWGKPESRPKPSPHGLLLASRLDHATWKRHARDALIAGHVGPKDVLWTKNPRDFLAIGLRPEQVLTV